MQQISSRSIRWLGVLLVAGSLVAAAHAQEMSADLQGISRMVKQGQRATALAKLNDYLTQNPKDLTGRFMKGVLLVEQVEQSRSKDSKEVRDPNRYREPISVFYGIIKDYPERPEPYNNLAAIYASLNQWDKAKEMLELAIRTNPSYATAHENLGDVYAKLASHAYEKALQLDTNSPAVQSKLKMIGDLFPVSGGKLPPAAVAPRQVASAEKAAAVPSKPPVPTRSTSGAFKPTVPAAGKDSDASPVAATNTARTSADASGVTDVVNTWAGAWSKKDVSAYLAHYGEGFKPSGLSRSAWKRQREDRLTRPKSIQVDVSDINIQTRGDEAIVTFKQTYKSDLLGPDSMMKRLVLAKEGNQWRIVRESRR